MEAAGARPLEKERTARVIAKPLPKLTPVLTPSERTLCDRVKKVTRAKKLPNAKKATIRRMFNQP